MTVVTSDTPTLLTEVETMERVNRLNALGHVSDELAASIGALAAPREVYVLVTSEGGIPDVRVYGSMDALRTIVLAEIRVFIHDRVTTIGWDAIFKREPRTQDIEDLSRANAIANRADEDPTLRDVVTLMEWYGRVQEDTEYRVFGPFAVKAK